MTFKIIVPGFLLSCCFYLINSQCIPDVGNIDFNNTTLTWREANSCNDTTYLVSIYAFDSGIIEYVGEIAGGSLDCSFLPFCRSHVFTIAGVSYEHVGPYSQLAGVIPCPEDAIITVASLTGYQVDEDVVLQWYVPLKYRYCLDTFKLSLWDEDSVDPEEIFTNQNRFTLGEVVPCMSYQVDISVVYSSTEHPVTRFNYSIPAVPNNPSLQSLEQFVTSITTTWSLESYVENRCRVSALHITGTATNTTIAFQDSPERLPIQVSIPGLRANTMYYFNVTSINEGGVSRPFQLAVQTLPIELETELDGDE